MIGQRPGFTLIELVVALVVSGFVLVAARAVVENLGDTVQRVSASTTENESAINAERELRALVGRVESATISAAAVAGDRQSARLATWCEVPAGWLEPCRVALGFERVDAKTALVLTVAGEKRVVMSPVTTGELRYLVQANGAWLSDWNSQITTPMAIIAIVDRDTLILRIGERG